MTNPIFTWSFYFHGGGLLLFLPPQLHLGLFLHGPDHADVVKVEAFLEFVLLQAVTLPLGGRPEFVRALGEDALEGGLLAGGYGEESVVRLGQVEAQ